ncbi:MAG: AAA family ATPase [Clostridiales bacterium]|nr:AAA family ATPase [Clostridiales bacterium]
MGTGILVCGCNGSGKSTLGKALAQELSYLFIDNEDLFFPRTDLDYPYASPRSRKEAEALLLREIRAHEDFVFAAVKGDYCREARSSCRYAVLLEAPKEIRFERVRRRSFEKFGSRMLPGGELYEQEAAFFRQAMDRSEQEVFSWAETLPCPVLRADGTRPVPQNVEWIMEQMRRFHPQF